MNKVFMKYIDDQFLAELQKKIDNTSRTREVLLDERRPDVTENQDIEIVDSEFDLDHAFNKIVRLVSVRERCTSELHDRLLSLGYPERIVDDVIEKSVRIGLVDDLRFADIFIRSCISKNKGQRGIEMELKKRHIDCYDVEGWPEEYLSDDPESSEYTRALAFIKRKPPTAKNKRDAAFRKLVSHGFDIEVARRASQQFCDDIGWSTSRW